jgi:hypothetical protein
MQRVVATLESAHTAGGAAALLNHLIFKLNASCAAVGSHHRATDDATKHQGGGT